MNGDGRSAAFGPGVPGAPPEGPHPRTALRVDGDGAQHLEAHLARLGAARWLQSLRPELEAWAGRKNAALRLSLDPAAEVLWARLEPLPETPTPWRMCLLPHPLPPAELPRIKGMDGRWDGDVLARARSAGAHDALLLWPDGTVAETAIAAVALERDGLLVLPPTGGRVASLGERLMLPDWARFRGLRIVYEPLRPADLEGSCWCVNAVRGVWRAELHSPIGPVDPLD